MTEEQQVEQQAPPVMTEYNEPEAAAVLSTLSHGVKVKPNTLCQWRRRGIGPAFFRIGSQIRYRLEDLKLFVAESRIDPREQPKKPHRRIRRGSR